MYGKIYFYLHKILERFLPTWFKWKKRKRKKKERSSLKCERSWKISPLSKRITQTLEKILKNRAY